MSKFESRVRKHNSLQVIDLIGELDAHTSLILEKELLDLINQGQTKIILNFSELKYISSAGLGVFMGCIDDIRSKNGDLKFSNLSDKIFEVFDLLGFPHLFEIYNHEQEAMDKFLSDPNTQNL